MLSLALTLATDGSGISPPARSGVWFRTRTHMGQASGLLMWVTGPHKPEAASVGGLSRYRQLLAVWSAARWQRTGSASHSAAPTSSTRPRSARSRLSLFREFGPCRCEQNPRLIKSAVWLLGHVATVVGLRAVCLREPVKLFRIGHCWPDRKGKQTPASFGGRGRTAGAFRGLLNQPSSDGEKGNAIGVVSFRRVMIEIVDMVVVPVVVAAMMTTIRASQPDQPACAIARRPRGEFPCQPQAVALADPRKGWLQKSHSWPPTARHRRLSAGIMPEIDNNRSNGT